MLGRILVLSLFAFAQTDVQVDYYAEYADAIDAAEDQLRQQILSMDGNIPGITDPRRHYVILVTHIARVADELAHRYVSDYEEVYMRLLPTSIAYATDNVQSVVDETEKAIKSINDDTKKIRSLLKVLCPPSEKYEVCDQVVSKAIEGDHDRYLVESKIMNSIGQAAQILLKKNLVAVADNYEEVEYLLVNMNNLSDIINKVANFIQIDEHITPTRSV